MLVTGIVNNRTHLLRSVGFGAAALLLAIVFGIVAGIGNDLLLAIFGAGCLCFVLFAFTQFVNTSFPQLALLVVISLFFILEIIHKTWGLPLYGYWQALILGIGFWGLKGLWKEISGSFVLKLSALSFAGFLLVAIISTLLASYITADASLYQFLSDLKLPLALAFGIFMASKVDIASALERTIVVIVPIIIIFLFLQWVAPGAYLAVFRASRIPVELAGIFPSPGLSIFNHPSILAATTAALSIYCFAKWQIYKKQSGYTWVALLVLVFLLIASNQRQEIFAFILAVSSIYFFISRQGVAKRVLFAAVVSLAVFSMYAFVFGDMFKREEASWGISSSHAATHPRAQLYEGAVYLAKAYFPLGSGLGTYGGAGSSKFDLALPYKLGFSHTWWWQEKEAYLLDTYWPNSLAESGVLGALLLLLHYLFFGLHAFVKAHRAQSAQARMAWLCAGGSFMWVLFNTPTSPGFQEIRLLFFPALMFGMAVHLDRKITNNE